MRRPAARVALAALGLVALAACATTSRDSSNPYEGAAPAARESFKSVALPFPIGTGFVVSQGAFGAASHGEPGNGYSWDFDVPFGTPVTAVEAGRVLEVWSPNKGGGCDPKFSALAHNVKVEHADGTVAQYVHVESRVEQGQSVARGEVIAVTGENGWLCRPQLHFGIYASRTELWASPKRKTIPVLFKGLLEGMARAGLHATVPRLEGDETQREIGHVLLPHPLDASRHVELYWEKPVGNGPFPVVVEVHGHQEPDRPGAAIGFPWYEREAHAGYLAVGVSQPGYGRSDGPPDYCGPDTQAAVREVLRWVRALPIARPDRIALYGVSRGAAVAAMVATREHALAALVLDVGFYDMKSSYRSLQESKETRGIALNMAAEAGTNDEAFHARSALEFVDDIRTPALIMTSERDHPGGRAQARRLAAELRNRGVPVKFVDFPGLGHFIPHKIRNAEIDPFLRTYLGAGIQAPAR